MSSASKTLGLLGYFSTTHPDLGLSQLCRLAKRDKATTYRQLQVLEDAGFVEQNQETKRYRLGPALLRLGHVREATVPRKTGAMAALTALAEATGETAHVSVVSGVTLHSLASVESSKHSARVKVDRSTLPLHATASGHVVLAFGHDDLFAAALAELQAFTAKTPNDRAALKAAVERARVDGFGQSDGFLDAQTRSLAMPVFDQSGGIAGAVSVACLASRYGPDVTLNIQQHLMAASRQISKNWGGAVSDQLEQTWDNALSNIDKLEPVQ